MDMIERDLMQIFKCDPSWPICLYDFSYKNKCPSYFCYRVEHNLNEYIIPNYFDRIRRHDGPTTWMAMTGIGIDELVIERNDHLCCSHRHFVKFFMKRFIANDP